MKLETHSRPRSIGKLRKKPKTKERSPDMTGTLYLQRHTAAAIVKAFEKADDQVVCNIAAWVNQDQEGQYLTVELSPKYVAPDTQTMQSNRLGFIFDNEEDRA
jgi:hypothetical protein